MIAAALPSSVTASPSAARRLPDLATMRVQDPRPHASPGDQFTVRAKIRNVGRAPARASTVAFHLGHHRFTAPGDLPVLRVRIGRLAAQTSLVVKRTATVPSSAEGGYFLVVCADDRDQVTEVTEGNNCRASTRQITIR